MVEIHFDLRFSPVRFTAEGDEINNRLYLLKSDNRKFAFYSFHVSCEGVIRVLEVSADEKEITCLSCPLSVKIPSELETYGHLRQYSELIGYGAEPI